MAYQDDGYEDWTQFAVLEEERQRIAQEKRDVELALALQRSELGPERERAGSWEVVGGKSALPSIKAQLKKKQAKQKSGENT